MTDTLFCDQCDNLLNYSYGEKLQLVCFNCKLDYDVEPEKTLIYDSKSDFKKKENALNKNVNEIILNNILKCTNGDRAAHRVNLTCPTCGSNDVKQVRKKVLMSMTNICINNHVWDFQ